jgi:hypothetical protein
MQQPSHSDSTQRGKILAEPAIRQSKRHRILNLFAQHLGKRYDSRGLHGMFGSSFRSRVSEINLDPASPIRIRNKTLSRDDGETSVYWGEARSTELLFGEVSPERYPD